jgi:MFS family permease
MQETHVMRNKPLILVALLLAAFVINLDITIVNVGLPTLVRELHASNSQLQWVVVCLQPRICVAAAGLR